MQKKKQQGRNKNINCDETMKSCENWCFQELSICNWSWIIADDFSEQFTQHKVQ